MLIYGIGGHAKVVLDCLKAEKHIVDGIFHDLNEVDKFLSYPVLGKYKSEKSENTPLIIAVGDNKIRKEVSGFIKHKFGKIAHPSALISEYSEIDEGTVVLHNSVIQAGTKIGKHCIINTSASIDHDNELDNFVHISPNATLSGTVKVGEGTWIGSGATVINNITIGKWCVIGAGTVITKDIPDYSVVVGNPGKIIKQVKF